jgi:transcriptional regulator with XRE-family HTH domain
MFRLNYYYKRYYKHMNQTEFAQLLGISQSFVSQLLKGRRMPSADILFQISEKLNVPVEKLYVKKKAI